VEAVLALGTDDLLHAPLAPGLDQLVHAASVFVVSPQVDEHGSRLAGL
jgi:hypothetical protein